MWFEKQKFPCLVRCTAQRRDGGITLGNVYKALGWFYEPSQDDFYLDVIDDAGENCGYSAFWFRYEGTWDHTHEYYQTDPQAGQF